MTHDSGGMTNADVMTGEEMAHADLGAELRMDAADEREACGEGHCICYCPDRRHDCGCDCPCDDDCCIDGGDCEDAEEWQPGECDHCYGQTVQGPLGPIHCACAIGEGADPEDCHCGPPSGDDT